MKFEELLEKIYVGKLSEESTNNNIYLDLNKEQLMELRKFLKENPTYHVINPSRNGMHFQKNSIEELKNIEVDFSKLSIHDLLSYILFVLKIDFRVNFFSYEDLLLFIELVRRNGKGINLHLFNANLLNVKEQRLLNDLMFLNLTTLCMQVYLEEGEVLSSKYDEKGRSLIDEEHYHTVNVEGPVYKKKLVNDLEKKAA